MVLTESIRRGGVKPGLSAVLGLITGFGGILVLIWPLLTGTSEHLDPLGAGRPDMSPTKALRSEARIHARVTVDSGADETCQV